MFRENPHFVLDPKTVFSTALKLLTPLFPVVECVTTNRAYEEMGFGKPFSRLEISLQTAVELSRLGVLLTSIMIGPESYVATGGVIALVGVIAHYRKKDLIISTTIAGTRKS